MTETVETPNEQTTQTEEKKNARQMSFSVLDDGQIRAEFGPGLDPITFNPAALPEALFPMALAEGIISRLRSYASKLTGDNRTPEKLRAATAAGLENLQKGEWKVEREPGQGGDFSIEQEAAHRYRMAKWMDENPGQEYPVSLEDNAKAFAALTDEQKAKLKATSRYQAAAAAVKSERNAKRATKLAEKAKKEEAEVDF